MIVIWVIALPLLGGLLAWLAGRRSAEAARWISALILGVDLLLILLWFVLFSGPASTGNDRWLAEFDHSWIPVLGARFHLAIDGVSLILVGLSLILGIISVITSWTDVRERVGSFHMNLLWTLAGVIGVFVALDLFLFYFFWELMLVPMYFLIALWGHENRTYASMKFFVFTQFSSLLMLIAILGLYFVHGGATGIYTFEYQDLMRTTMTPSASMWLMLGFFISFAVKLPVLPVHSWLPDAHTEAPTAGSVILAGLMLKTGAYGMLRFMVPLFPDAVSSFSSVGMLLAVAGILYGAVMAFSQTDLKRLVAYTSISHMGFVLLGLLAWNRLALQGVIIQIICHGLSTGGLFILAGWIQERIHTRDVNRMGSFRSSMPRLGAIGMVFAMASLGLPGLGNFIGEFLVLLGTYQRDSLMAAVAATGFIASSVYSLWIIQKIFHGTPNNGTKGLLDTSIRETLIGSVMIALLIIIGLYPQPVINIVNPPLEEMTTRTSLSEKHSSGKNEAHAAPSEGERTEHEQF